MVMVCATIWKLGNTKSREEIIRYAAAGFGAIDYCKDTSALASSTTPPKETKHVVGLEPVKFSLEMGQLNRLEGDEKRKEMIKRLKQQKESAEAELKALKAGAPFADPLSLGRNYHIKELEKAIKSLDKAISGGCFIATAVYGSYHAREVIALRNFRDRVLLGNSLGKLLVNIYYALSPGIAELVKQSPLLSRSCRFVLDKMVLLTSIRRNG
jgi:hypothetical protein